MRSFAALALLAPSAFATYGVDISQYCDSFSCLKDNGYSFAIPRAWKSYGGFDSNVKKNIDNAWNSGFAHVDVYMFPCRGKSASD